MSKRKHKHHSPNPKAAACVANETSASTLQDASTQTEILSEASVSPSDTEASVSVKAVAENAEAAETVSETAEVQDTQITETISEVLDSQNPEAPSEAAGTEENTLKCPTDEAGIEENAPSIEPASEISERKISDDADNPEQSEISEESKGNVITGNVAADENPSDIEAVPEESTDNEPANNKPPKEEPASDAAEQTNANPSIPPSDRDASGNLIAPPKRSFGLKVSIFIQQAINIIAIIVFIGSALYLCKIGISYYQSSHQYDKLNDKVVQVATLTPVPTETEKETEPESIVAEITNTPTPTPTPAEHESYGYTPLVIDFDALNEEAEGVVGWIDVPGCEVSYPIMYGMSNSYYLRHTYNGYYNVSGSIFIDEGLSPDFDSQKNTLIYGHNQNNGKMFSNLHRLEQRSEEFALAPYNRLIVIYLPDEIKYYTIVSVRIRPKTDSAYYMSYQNDQQYQTYIDTALEQSMWDYGREVTTDDQMITLVTCMEDSDYRMVVNAVEIE